MGAVLSWLKSLFWAQEMEIAVLGLQNAGKSSFVEVINTGAFRENLAPTVGFNMYKVQKGKVTIKVWDMGGQEKFRSMWERYCRGVEVVVFIVDSSDASNVPVSSKELGQLMAQPTLVGVPLLVLLNKNDLDSCVDSDSLVKQLGLQSISNREVAYYSISCKNIVNIDKTIDWIIKRANSKNRN